jgi:hypothetical protein
MFASMRTHLQRVEQNRSARKQRARYRAPEESQMPPSLFPSDDELPTWLHTTLCIAIVSPFAVFLLWFGIAAIVTGHLEPLSGPEPGQYFFGESAIDGAAARWAGVALTLLGTTFLSLGVSFTRYAAGRRMLRIIPWLLLIASLAISFLVRSSR